MVSQDNSAFRRDILPIAALIFVTAIWGMTFVMVKDAVTRMPVMDFLAIRFALATAVMILLRPRALKLLDSKSRFHGILLGITLGAGYAGQTFGLQHTSAAVSGFITGMFVVFTPLIAGLILRRPIGGMAWLAVGLATVGLALLSLRGFALGTGELLTLTCALFFAIHIIGLGEWSAGADSYALAIVQLAVVTIISGIAALPGGITLPPDSTAWWAVIITAVFATAIAFVIQTWAQSVLSPTRTAVVLTMEPVFAGIFAVLIGGEHLGLRTLAGGALVLTAMYLVELGPRQAREGELAHLEV
ncbi:MAG TPA: DMT family transporter [Candidatus Aquicultor sp.]|jgi:drug/metabolite transporter (DMT)-like permease